MAKQKTESSVGKIAAKMLETALQQTIASSGLQLSDDEANRKNKKNVALTPARKSKTYSRMVRGDRTKLSGVAIHMGKHMFIHHYGANTYRESHEVRRKGTAYKRAGSRIRLKARNIIARAVRKSGAVEYITTEISAIRAEEVVTKIVKSFDDGK